MAVTGRISASLPEVTFVSEGEIALASSHWLLSMNIDIRPYAKIIVQLDSRLAEFKENTRENLAEFLPSRGNQSEFTSFEASVVTLANLMERELSKFGDDIVTLKAVYHSILIAFLQTNATNSKQLLSSEEGDLVRQWENPTSELK